MDIDIKLLRLLLDIGILATDEGKLDSAEAIFIGISKFKTNSAYPFIGLSKVAMCKGNHKKAIKILEEAPHQNSEEKEICNCYLGTFLKIAGYSERARNLLEKIKTHGTSDIAVKFACEALEADFAQLTRELLNY